jgi:hypothetical protein
MIGYTKEYVRILSVGTPIENDIDASTSGGGDQCVLVTPLDTDDSAHCDVVTETDCCECERVVVVVVVVNVTRNLKITGYSRTQCPMNLSDAGYGTVLVRSA